MSIPGNCSNHCLCMPHVSNPEVSRNPFRRSQKPGQPIDCVGNSAINLSISVFGVELGRFLGTVSPMLTETSTTSRTGSSSIRSIQSCQAPLFPGRSSVTLTQRLTINHDSIPWVENLPSSRQLYRTQPGVIPAQSIHWGSCHTFLSRAFRTRALPICAMIQYSSTRHAFNC